MFVGTSQRKLDDKGRIVLPAALRDELTGPGYIAVTDECLSIWTEAGYHEFAELLTKRVREGQDGERLSQMVKRKLHASTERIRADSQGRITLPAALLEKAGIGSGAGTEVVVNGNYESINIWAPEVWARLDEESDDEFVEALRMGGF